MYCVCLKDGNKCNDQCSCDGCLNNDDEEAETRRQKQKTKLNEEKNIRKPCRCTKNKCEQAYCICFGSGLGCFDGCSCTNCHNTDQHRKAKAVKLEVESTPQTELVLNITPISDNEELVKTEAALENTDMVC
jgi:protein lin-54